MMTPMKIEEVVRVEEILPYEKQGNRRRAFGRDSFVLIYFV